MSCPAKANCTHATGFRRITGQTGAGALIVRQYPQAEGGPCCPLPRSGQVALWQRYVALADAEIKVRFVGRLAQSRCSTKDGALAAAPKLGDELLAFAAPT